MNREWTSTSSRLEKKLNEMELKEKKLQDEVDDLKQERDWKIFENQAVLDKEKELYKAKLNDVEKKLKEAEQKKSQLLFEFEKDRAWWTLERDHYETQI